MKGRRKERESDYGPIERDKVRGENERKRK